MKTYKTSESVRRKCAERMDLKRREAGIPKRKTFEERFFDNLSPVPESGCLIWLGFITKSGYGQISYKGKLTRAHRVAWEVKFGEIPEGLHVLHKCDVRCCVNPDHLFLGSHQENMRDKVNKGRHPVGSNSPISKLTDEQVEVILTDTSGPTLLAAKFNVSPSTICDIRKKRSWKHVNANPNRMAEMWIGA